MNETSCGSNQAQFSCQSLRVYSKYTGFSDLFESHLIAVRGNTCATAHTEGSFLEEKFSPCKDCALGKARQDNASKKTVSKSTNTGERFFIDISSPSTKNMAGKKH